MRAGESGRPAMGTEFASGEEAFHPKETLMAHIEKSIEVSAPLRAVYNQWTQFEDFPRFMEGVKEVHQIDDTHLQWRAEIGGKDKEWDAVITEQIPDSIIAWRSVAGAENAGRVEFRPSGTGTRITLKLTYDPEGAVEKIGDWAGVVGRRVEGDLKRFRDFIESRGRETGQWRGEVHRGQKVSGEHARAESEADADPTRFRDPG
jgi:uncharacterized membrane protein